jgi:hypothetical protein
MMCARRIQIGARGPSPHSGRDKVRRSGLWNQRHVDENYIPGFLDVLEAAIERNTICVAHFAQSAIDQKRTVGEWDEVDRYARRLENYIREELAWPKFIVARGRALASWGRGKREPDLAAELKRLRDSAVEVGLVRAAAALERTGLDG